MNLTMRQFSDKYRIPMTKCRRAERDGNLVFHVSTEKALEDIARYANKGALLTAGHLRYLVLNPQKVNELDKSVAYVKSQIAALGNVVGEALTLDQFPVAKITNCAAGDPGSIQALAEWMASVIPPAGCSYHYIAVRALLNVSDDMFEPVYKAIGRAFSKARKHPALDGMSETVNRATRFFQKQFDL